MSVEGPYADGEGVKMTAEFDEIELANWRFERYVMEQLAEDAGSVVEYRGPDVGILHEMGLEAEAGFWQLILSNLPNQIMHATCKA